MTVALKTCSAKEKVGIAGVWTKMEEKYQEQEQPGISNVQIQVYLLLSAEVRHHKSAKRLDLWITSYSYMYNLGQNC